MSRWDRCPNVTVTEGEEAPIRLMLDGPATAPVVLSYEIVDVSATIGEDYTILGPDGDAYTNQ